MYWVLLRLVVGVDSAVRVKQSLLERSSSAGQIWIAVEAVTYFVVAVVGDVLEGTAQVKAGFVTRPVEGLLAGAC